jgi:hypothetical protein
MTAEVAILNKSAVALAADSKVSVGASRTEKTYDTQNKIFTLSKVHPVGILIYNNADFMGYPWETIIKLYRSTKKRADRATIKDWASDFQTFLRSFGAISSIDIRENVRGVLDSLFDALESEALAFAASKNFDVPSKDYDLILLHLLREKLAAINRNGKLLSTAQTKNVLAKHRGDILDAASNVLSSTNNKLLNKLCTEFGLKALLGNTFSPLSTGIVIAGFGRDEIFPSLATFETDGYIGNQVKVSRLDVKSVSKSMRSLIRPFAQNDIVHRFMEGIDPYYSYYVDGLMQTLFVEGCLKVFERWAPTAKKTDKARNAIRQLALKQIREIDNKANDYRRDKFWLPTTQMVSLLPKDELAHLAESLVELTALHRKVSRELETVGGPIDVAVISKSDGFVWVRRKHYFSMDLNPQFSHNYMREIVT